MHQYLDTLRYILNNGEERPDRTTVGTISSFGMQQRYDLRKGFPAVTTKKLAWRQVVSELLWFLEGSNDERRLAEILYGTRSPDKKTIWTDNANSPYWKPKSKFDGDVGNIYGVGWRSWPTNKKQWISSNEYEFETIDQIVDLIDGIKKDPYGRRHILTAWNPGLLSEMALPPCHVLSQFYVSTKNELSCQLYQRSGDVFLGVPFNIASYALLTHMIAQICGLGVGEFVHVIGDAHLYLTHLNAVKEQLSRSPTQLPTLWLNPNVIDIDKFTLEDIKLENYICQAAIKAPMAI